MSMRFVPCVRCRRHVRADETRCPFCDATTTALAPAPRTAGRLPRNAFVAVTTGLTLVAACESPQKPVPVYGGPPTEQTQPTEIPIAVYGGPPTNVTPLPPPSSSSSAAPSTSSSGSKTTSSASAFDPLGGLLIGDADVSGSKLGTSPFPTMAAAYGAPPTNTGLTGDPSIPPSSDGLKVPTGEVSTAAATGEVAKVKGADAVVAKNRWRFKACYNKALAANPNEAGAVTVAVTIGDDGLVTSAATSSSTVSASLAACIAASFNSMKFDPPAGGSAKLSVKVTLSAKK